MHDAFSQMLQVMSQLKSFINNLASQNEIRKEGKFPMQPEANHIEQLAISYNPISPSVHVEEAHAITTLRSGKLIQKDILMNSLDPKQSPFIPNSSDDLPEEVEFEAMLKSLNPALYVTPRIPLRDFHLQNPVYHRCRA